MKNKFSEYYYLSEEQLKAIIENNSDNTLYVFDTNAFLSIYDVSKETAETTLEIFEFVGNHSWMPYQVGLEFHRNRINKFKKRRTIIADSKSDMATSTSEIRRIFKDEVLFDKQLDPEIKSLVEKLCKKGEALLADKLTEAEDREKNDVYLSRIENIYSEDKIGNPLNKQQYEVLQKTMDKQWEKKKGLGSKDYDDKKNQFEIYPGNFVFCNAYGDPVIIEEIRNEVSRRNQNQPILENVVFVSNDQKSDFITELANGQNAPQFYLQRYMCEESENYAVPLKQFVQVTLEEFVNHMIGKIPSRSETQITEAAKEIGVLAEKDDFITSVESNEFMGKRKLSKDAFLSMLLEMKIANSSNLMLSLKKMKEIHDLHNPNIPFEQTALIFSKRNENMHWEEIEQILERYESRLMKYGYENVRTIIEEELINAQGEYAVLLARRVLKE